MACGQQNRPARRRSSDGSPTILAAQRRGHAPKGDWHAVDAFAFDRDLVDRLVLALAEQEVWAQGDTPSIH